MLACRYFDRGLAGYIDEDDLRDIASMTGDYMSRERHSHAPRQDCRVRPTALSWQECLWLRLAYILCGQGCGDSSVWASE